MHSMKAPDAANLTPDVTKSGPVIDFSEPDNFRAERGCERTEMTSAPGLLPLCTTTQIAGQPQPANDAKTGMSFDARHCKGYWLRAMRTDAGARVSDRGQRRWRANDET